MGQFYSTKVRVLHAVCLIVFFTSMVIAQNHSNVNLPNCEELTHVPLNVDEILASNDRHLLERELDKIYSLYCVAIQTGHKELEALSYLKIVHELQEALIEGDEFKKILDLLDRSINICKQYGFDKILIWNYEKMCTMFTSNKMFGQANLFADEFVAAARRMGDSSLVAEGYMLRGRLYREMGRLDKSERALNESLNLLLFEDKDVNRLLAYTYLHLSALKRKQEKYTESIEFANQGMIYARVSDGQPMFLQAQLAMQLIESKLESGDFEVEYLFDMVEQVTDTEPYMDVLKNVLKGNILEKNQEINEAIVQYVKTMRQSLKTGTHLSTMEVYERLIPLLTENGEITSRALESNQLYIETVDHFIQQNYAEILFRDNYYQLENEKKNSELLSLRIRNLKYLLFFLVGLGLALVGISFLLLRQRRLKKSFYGQLRELNTRLLDSNSNLKQSNQELEERKEELRNDLKEKVLLIGSYQGAIKELQHKIDQHKGGITQELAKILTQTIDNSHNINIIQDVSRKFLSINEDLIKNLSAQHPNLSANDILLCNYIVMGFTYKEIASMEYKSPDSIKVAVYRLRKKLNLQDKTVSLISYLNSFKPTKMEESVELATN